MKINIAAKIVLVFILIGSFFASNLRAEETRVGDEKLLQLQKENTNLKKEISELTLRVEKLEKERIELKELLKQQDKILTALAKTKILTKKAWDSLVDSVKDLNTKVDKKVKELEQKENK